MGHDYHRLSSQFRILVSVLPGHRMVASELPNVVRRLPCSQERAD